jgi:hypothetical protein
MSVNDFEDIPNLYKGIITRGIKFTSYEDLPKRCTVITEDDVLNLRITLANVNTIEELLKQI